ncbi:MAG TPA: hypothetical protein VEC11_13020 [Allosphingosinicella sp.]|nr:hypothetical protein [Allosphingosinicella sp.]
MVRLNDPYLLLAVDLINLADPDEAGTGMRIADDLMKAGFFADDSALPICLQRLNGLLADPSVCSAELKGLLNRASNKTWSIQYDLGPRQFLEALKTALEAYIRRHPPGSRAN